MLTSKEILVILNMLTERRFLVIVEGKNVKVLEQSASSGYSNDPEISALQAKLSIMLQAVNQKETRCR
jgi:hypothetical protein